MSQLNGQQEDLVPHAPLILLFTSSAQTHIFPEIRIDAIRFLNIFLEYFPEVIVRGWDTANNSTGSRVLEGYLGVLSAGTITGDAEGDTVAILASYVLIQNRASGGHFDCECDINTGCMFKDTPINNACCLLITLFPVQARRPPIIITLLRGCHRNSIYFIDFRGFLVFVALIPYQRSLYYIQSTPSTFLNIAIIASQSMVLRNGTGS